MGLAPTLQFSTPMRRAGVEAQAEARDSMAPGKRSGKRIPSRVLLLVRLERMQVLLFSGKLSWHSTVQLGVFFTLLETTSIYGVAAHIQGTSNGQTAVALGSILLP